MANLSLADYIKYLPVIAAVVDEMQDLFEKDGLTAQNVREAALALYHGVVAVDPKLAVLTDQDVARLSVGLFNVGDVVVKIVKASQK